MQRTKAPYRADHVGSLLRPAALKEARARRAKGEITAEALRQIEDREIEKVIRKQEEVGLKLATDGELRRSWWQFDFFKGLDGVEMYSTGKGIIFAGVETKAESVRTSASSASPAIRTSPTSSSSRTTPASREDDHPGARRAALPPRPPSVSKSVYPDLDSVLPRSRRGLPARRSMRSTTPAAAICSSTTPPGR